MTTALYLRGAQGIGKSLPCDFLMQNVIGMNNSYLTQDPSCLIGFNWQLYRKRLLILEELPCATTGSWKSISTALKQYITGGYIEIKRKYKDGFQYRNPLCLILLTNHDAIMLEATDRRYICLDVWGWGI